MDRTWTPLVSAGDPRASAAREAVAAIAADLEAHAAGPVPSLAGEAGIALFFSYLEQAGQLSPAAGARAEAAQGTLRGWLAGWPGGTSGLGLLGGAAGVGWVVEHLDGGVRRDGAPTGTLPLERADDLLARLDAAVFAAAGGEPLRPDLFDGLSGWGVYGLERWPRDGSPALLGRILERLAGAGPEPLDVGLDVGMAHGVAAWIALLARCRTEMPEEGSVDALLARAVQVALRGLHVAPDREDLAWCAGRAGLAAALLAAGRASGRDEWEAAGRNLARAAAVRDRAEAGVPDAGLCHGTAGLCHLFHRLYQVTGDPLLGEAAGRWLDRTLELRRPGEGIGGYLRRARRGQDGAHGWVADPGFLTGAAGIGLALLATVDSTPPGWDRLLLLSGRAGVEAEVAHSSSAAESRTEAPPDCNQRSSYPDRPAEDAALIVNGALHARAPRRDRPAPPSRSPAQARALDTGDLTASWCVLRTPLLPLAELVDWSSGLAAPAALAAGAQDNDLAAALAADRALLRSRLTGLLARPEVREAVFVASPALDEGLAAWRREPEGKKGRRAEQTLVRYFSRMAARATPFGLFAGFTLAPVDSAAPGAEGTRLALAPRRDYRRVTRLDMDYLSALCEALGRDPTLRRELRYEPSSSLHRSAGRWRYVEARLRDRSRSHHLVTVDANEFLDTALRQAAEVPGGALLGAIAEAVVAADPDGEITRADAEAFVEELIDAQLLVPLLAPPVTGPDPLAALLETLAACPSAAPAAARLAEVRAELQRLDAAGLGQDPERYREIAARLADLPAEPQLSRLFQVDLLTRGDGAALGSDVVTEIARGVEVLRRIAGNRGYDPLKAFRDAFVSRWGEGREIPLLAALDDETGIPLDGPGASPETEASPLLRGVAFAGGPARTAAARWRDADAWLLGRLEEVWRKGERELALTPEDLVRLALTDPAPLPDAFHASAVLAATGSPASLPGEALARGDYEIFLLHASGPSGVRMVGRFGHADPAVRDAVEAHLRTEEARDPEALFAEVVHLPEGRVGNILGRPVLRGWEIPYLGRSGAPPERQIPVSDLLVSVTGERVVLRSRSHGRRVEPRLTNAHNYEKGLAVYRFLCSVQQQGVAHGVLWSWGVWSQAAFTPRVRLGRLVLARARWRATGDELAALARESAPAARWRAVQAWRARRGLPRWVVLSEFDNELLVDLDNVLAVDSLLETVKGRPEALLVEPFLDPARLCAHGPEGALVHELFIPFERTAPAARRPPRLTPISEAGETAPRTFPPGSGWLFAKLYTGTATADRVLREVVAPLRRKALAEGLADAWFFLRYGDPDWHLRLRFRGAPERLAAELWPALAAAAAPLQREGGIWKLQIDTYEREVERYGGPEGVEIAERLFEADSEAALAILEELQGDQGADHRWRLALLGVDRLLRDLALTPAERLEVMRDMQNALAEEMGAGKPLRLSLDRRFRAEQKSLDTLLRATADDLEEPLAAGLRALEQRSARNAPLIAGLRALAAAGRLHRTLPELARSYVHMHVNRLIRAAARPHEVVLYDFLARIYESRQARGEE